MDIKDYVIKECKNITTDKKELNNLIILSLYQLYQHDFFEKEYDLLDIIYFKKTGLYELYHPTLNNRLGAVNQQIPETLFSYKNQFEDIIQPHPYREKNILEKQEELSFDIYLNSKNYYIISKYQSILETSQSIEIESLKIRL